MTNERHRTKPLEAAKIAGLLLAEAIGTNAVNLVLRPKKNKAPRFRKPFDARRIAHNLWVRATTSKEDLDEIEQTLDLSTSGTINLSRDEYEKLNKRTIW